MEQIINLLLEECKIMFIEFKPDNDYISYGLYPQKAIIKYVDKYDKYISTGDNLMAWYLESGCIQKLNNKDISPKLEPSSGMYYCEAQFIFSIRDDIQKANLSIWLGKRYGRCFIYNIVFKDGVTTLENKELTAIS